MKVSVNHIRQLNKDEGWAGDPAPDGVDALVERIGVRLGAVEETVPIGHRYDNVVIVEIVSVEDHPNADRLHVCMVDDGGVVDGIKRDLQGYIQVVCGAPNVRQGLKVVWLPPGATVPQSADTDPFVLEARELRGVVSNGMLASPRELAIGDNHDGILEIEDETIPAGTAFAAAFNLQDDVIIDMENKMFTHRPDCFGILGVAREFAGIQGEQFTSPAWYKHDITPPTGTGDLVVTVNNELPELVRRFVVLPMSNITVKPSPVWLQIALSRLGIRPINNIVDLTNYYMVLTGQPLHAYDYDKVVAQDAGATHATLTIRYPKAGEKLLLLNGKEVEPRDQAIMIATRDTLIGIGGVMGGGDTEVDDATKNIILECANFDMYSIRRTSMHNGVFTDAVTRFNKGQSPLQNIAVIAKIAADVTDLAGGAIAGDLVDDNHLSSEIMQSGSLEAPVSVSREFINARLGFDLSADEMAQLLRNVECTVDINDDTLTVKAPFWRTDIAIPEDVVEEVGRLYGFDKLPLSLPRRSVKPVIRDELVTFKATVRQLLARAGANEVLTYSFVHGKLLERVGQSADDAYQLSNALSPDLQYYRLSLTPSLLDKVHANVRAGYDTFALFEVNKVHAKQHVDEDGLPIEAERLALVVTDAKRPVSGPAGAPFYVAKQYATFLTDQLGVSVRYVAMTDERDAQAAPFVLNRSARIETNDGVALGIIGEYRQTVTKNLKLPVATAGFELDMTALLGAVKSTGAYQALPRFPKVEQDLCLRVNDTVTYGQLSALMTDALPNAFPVQTRVTIQPLDIYQAADTPTKQITFRLSVASYERTLTTAEVSGALDTLATVASDALAAQRV